MASCRFKTVRIEAPDILGSGVKITDGETGEEIPSVFSAEIHIVPDDIVRVNLGMFVEKLNVRGMPRLFLLGSKNGWETRKEVHKVVFTDGSELAVGDLLENEESKGDGTDAQVLG